MSTQTNNAYVTKSMNGIISYDDGAGGIMEGGTITANEFIIDEIQSRSPPNIVSLFTNTTTTINIGSSTSTLNVSNINVSNINVPLITFTTLNVSDANSSLSNSSTSNSSTANNGTTNSSTSNSSTANNGTTNSSTANSSTANNGTTNSSTANNGTTNSSTANSETTNASTLNASSFNISTTTGTTLNMSTANVSIIYTNEIQSATTANVSLFTLHTGNLNIGNISVNSMLIDSKNSVLSSVNNTTITAGGIIYLNSNGNTEICNSGFGGKMVLSGNQEIRAKDRSMPSYLFTDAFAGGDVTIGNASNNLYLDCPLSSSKSIKCVGLNVSTTANISTTNISTLNVSTTNISNLEVNTSTLVNSLTAQNISASFATISYLECTNISSLTPAAINRIYPNSTTGNIIIGQAQSGGGGIFLGSSTSATNASTINVSKINVSNLEVNVSTLVNSLTAQNVSAGNATISFLQNTYISSLGPTFTNNFYPDLTSGVVNLCNTDIFRGTINIAATSNVSNASTNTINIGSATTSSLVLGSNTMTGNMFLRTAGNLNLGLQSNQIQMGTSQAATNTISIGTTGASTLNLNCPITPNYNASYNATNGAGVNTNVGYIYNSNTPASFSLATNDAFYNCQQITLVDPGVYMIWIDNRLYNDNVGGSITLYYMRVMVGTTLGGTNVFSGYFNSYAELFNSTTPNSQIDSPFTLPYVNTTANQILYTRIRVGRSALGLFWDTSSFIKAVRIA